MRFPPPGLGSPSMRALDRPLRDDDRELAKTPYYHWGQHNLRQLPTGCWVPRDARRSRCSRHVWWVASSARRQLDDSRRKDAAGGRVRASRAVLGAGRVDARSGVSRGSAPQADFDGRHRGNADRGWHRRLSSRSRSEWKWQLKKGPLRPREKGPPVGSVSTSTLLRHSETAHPAPPAGNPPSPAPIPSRRFRSGAAFGVRWRTGSLGRCGRSGRARPDRAARPITAIRAAGRAVCHPKGRSGVSMCQASGSRGAP